LHKIQYFYTLKNIAKIQKMILIADSGSTKTAWKFIDNKKNADEMGIFYTAGINPFYQNAAEIRDLICDMRYAMCDVEHHISHISHLTSHISHLISHIFFYGAGCHFPDKKETVKSALQQIFPLAYIEINNDLLAACRALLGNTAGIACILGTGSNSCFYDGEKIAENVSPLGYILGDEGSGAVLGKLLVADILKNQLTETLKNKFLAQYGWADLQSAAADILDKVYKQPFPNRYLAKFTQFIGENRNEEAVYNLVYRSFRRFFERNVMQYERYPVAFVGSVAFYFKDILQTVADDLGIEILRIEQSPMRGLCAFHKTK
jgi:N-acetylglucosamine kinase-like BadF-type ATPase